MQRYKIIGFQCKGKESWDFSAKIKNHRILMQGTNSKGFNAEVRSHGILMQRYEIIGL